MRQSNQSFRATVIEKRVAIGTFVAMEFGKAGDNLCDLSFSVSHVQPTVVGTSFIYLTKFTPCRKFIMSGSDRIHMNFLKTLARRHLVYIKK